MLQEILPPDTALAFPALHELRPRWTAVDAFVEHVDTVARPEGYRLVGAFPDDAGVGAEASAVLGFRVSTTLSWSRHVYVDDLSTRAAARRRGLAGQLLTWVHEEAVRLGCGAVHLDSGVGPERYDAHRRYLRAGYAITAHHFVRPVGP